MRKPHVTCVYIALCSWPWTYMQLTWPTDLLKNQLARSASRLPHSFSHSPAGLVLVSPSWSPQPGRTVDAALQTKLTRKIPIPVVWCCCLAASHLRVTHPTGCSHAAHNNAAHRHWGYQSADCDVLYLAGRSTVLRVEIQCPQILQVVKR